jgi:hypothetical protein
VWASITRVFMLLHPLAAAATTLRGPGCLLPVAPR